MSEDRINQLLDRVAKLEVEVEHLKAASGYGLLELFGSQERNPLFLEAIAEIEAARATEKAAMSVTPPKKRVPRRAPP